MKDNIFRTSRHQDGNDTHLHDDAFEMMDTASGAAKRPWTQKTAVNSERKIVRATAQDAREAKSGTYAGRGRRFGEAGDERPVFVIVEEVIAVK